MTNELISKEDAVKDQLICAIGMYFRNEFPISCRTLAGSAFQVLHDKYGKEAEKEFYETLHESIQKEFRDIIKGPQNFFKHADKDPDKTIRFSELTTRFVIFSACGLL